MRDAVARKQANMASRVRGHIDATLGDTVDAQAQSPGLIEQARADAKPFYDAAFQTPVTMTPKLREFADSPIGREGLTAGRRDIENTPTSRRNLGSETPSREGHVWDPHCRLIGMAMSPCWKPSTGQSGTWMPLSSTAPIASSPRWEQ